MKKLLLSLFIICLLFFSFSCQTTEVEEGELTEEEFNELKRLKSIVDKHGLQEFVPEDAAAAEELYQQVDSLYSTDKKEAKKVYPEAIAKYRTVIDKSLPLFLDRRKKETDEVKISAEKIKANVAVKDEYEEALDLYNQALAEKEAGNYEESAELMAQAKEKFDAVYKKTKEKKDKSDSAIENLNKGKKDFEETAE